MKKMVIGFLARSGINVLCDNKAIMVIKHKKEMKNFIQNKPYELLVKVNLHDMLMCFEMGETYCLDQLAYEEFEKHVELSYFKISSHTGEKSMALYTVSPVEKPRFSF